MPENNYNYRSAFSTLCWTSKNDLQFSSFRKGVFKFSINLVVEVRMSVEIGGLNCESILASGSHNAFSDKLLKNYYSYMGANIHKPQVLPVSCGGIS